MDIIDVQNRDRRKTFGKIRRALGVLRNFLGSMILRPYMLWDFFTHCENPEIPRHAFGLSARHDFRDIFQCFDKFKYNHIKGLDEYNGDLGDLLMHYCGHERKFKQFCNNIKPFNYDHSGVHINYRKRNFKIALFMHDNLASFMNALFVDTNPIIHQIEEYTRPIKCWLSMFFSEETFSKLELLKKHKNINTFFMILKYKLVL